MSSMPSEAFDNSKRNQINVAIVGSVSVGKSTLLNTIFAEAFSDCKLKRTTMTPQVYYECGADYGAQSDLTTEIRTQNTVINQHLISKSDQQIPITYNSFLCSNQTISSRGFIGNCKEIIRKHMRIMGGL